MKFKKSVSFELQLYKFNIELLKAKDTDYIRVPYYKFNSSRTFFYEQNRIIAYWYTNVKNVKMTADSNSISIAFNKGEYYLCYDSAYDSTYDSINKPDTLDVVFMRDKYSKYIEEQLSLERYIEYNFTFRLSIVKKLPRKITKYYELK